MMTLVQNSRTLNLITIAVLLCLFPAGCTTTSQISTASASTLFEPGDKATITTSDGQVVKLKVDEVNKQGISGDRQFIAYADMRKIMLKEYDSEKTTEVVLVVAETIAVGYLFLRALAKGLQSYPVL